MTVGPPRRDLWCGALRRALRRVLVRRCVRRVSGRRSAAVLRLHDTARHGVDPDVLGALSVGLLEVDLVNQLVVLVLDLARGHVRAGRLGTRDGHRRVAVDLRLRLEALLAADAYLVSG